MKIICITSYKGDLLPEINNQCLSDLSLLCIVLTNKRIASL